MAKPPKSLKVPDGHVSIPDYARHAGVTRAAVVKAIEAGRLSKSVTEVGGFKFIAPSLADQEWAANTDQRSPGRQREKPQTYKAPAPKPTPSPRFDGDTGNDTAGNDTEPQIGDFDTEVDFQEARRQHEVYKAGLKRLELLELQGKVVRIADVTDTVAAEYARIRQRLLAIPSKAGLEVIGATDASDAAKIIESYIVEALTELSQGIAYADRPPSSGGVGEGEGPEPQAAAETQSG